jgi:putative ABC transport system permease protein
MKELLRRLHYLLHRRRFDDELAEEMAAHRAMADRDGGRPFGDALRLREEARDAWGWTWIDRLGQDVRYALRRLRNAPGFTAVAVLMLAVGIGVNVAAFGFFNMMVLRPLPVRDPASLRRFQRRAPEAGADNFPYAAVMFYREQNRTLSAVLALNISRVTLEGEQKPLFANFVTANFFTELGAPAGLGRLLDPSRDEGRDAEPAVVLAHGFWQRTFGSDPGVVGQSLRINGKPATVVGVASPQFSGLALDQPDLWVAMGQHPYFFAEDGISEFGDGGLSVFMWGRLRPGLGPKAAEDDLKTLAAELHARYPREVWEGETVPSEPGGFATRVVSPMYPAFGLVGALCSLILAVACGNLGSLLLARGIARAPEMSIRSAIGAGRARLVRQLFTESLLLAGLASAMGLALGYCALRGLMWWAGVPPWLDPTPDRRVVGFAIGIGFGAAILFGLTPALQVSRRSGRATMARRILIGAEVAASCVLLVVAALLVRAVTRATSAPLGFEYQRVISLDPGLWAQGYDPKRAQAYLLAMEGRLRELPGVESVSVTTNPPLGNRWSVRKEVVGGRAIGIHVNCVGPDFFRTMTIPILRGRNLRRGETGAIVVSESLARLEWPAEDPLGKSFRMGSNESGGESRATVVGVSGNARLVSPEDSDAVELYQIAAPGALPSVVVLIKTAAAPEALLPVVKALAKEPDPRLFPELRLMRTSFQEKVQTSRYAALGATVLGLVALVIACVGVVGLVAFAVAERTREIGIRMALGAPPGHVLSVVLRQLSRPVLAGLVLGTLGAAALSQTLRVVLYGVSNVDPASYLAAVAVFSCAVGAAAVVPARRALRVDPTVALRYE